MSEPKVILVNEKDQVIGSEYKMAAHENGLLHRAISVLIFNSKGEWLIQQRAKHKYHSGGLLTNSCCSHPYPDEETIDAAHRRLMEEMGLSCELEKWFEFIYKTDLDHGLSEHEYDHVFIGYTDEIPNINTDEADGFSYMTTDMLLKLMQKRPKQFTEWFKIIVPKVVKHHEFKLKVHA